MLKLPVAHTVNSPIKLIWAYAKRRVRLANTEFKLSLLEKLEKENLTNFKSFEFSKYVEQVFKEEEKFFEASESALNLATPPPSENEAADESSDCERTVTDDESASDDSLQ